MIDKGYFSIAILLIVLTLGGCGEKQAQSNSAPVKTVNVETQQLRTQEFSSYLRLVGTVEAANDIRLSAEASGRILKYNVQKGDYVKKGEVLAQIDDAQLKENVARLEAATSQAREMYQRQKRIWEEDSIGSELDYLNAKYNYQQSKASLEAVRVQLNNTTLTAPFDARIENIITESGEIVSPGVPMLRLIASEALKITAGVPARYSNLVSPSEPVGIWFDTQVTDTLEGNITFVGSSIDQQSRTFEIEILLPNQKHEYKVGMIANLRLRTLYRPNSIVISEEYLYEIDGKNIVFLVGKDSEDNVVARSQQVKLGPRYNNAVLIEAGLESGDQLITVGSSFLEDGMRIEVVDS